MKWIATKIGTHFSLSEAMENVTEGGGKIGYEKVRSEFHRTQKRQ